MIVLRIHDNNGIKDFLAGACSNTKDKSLIISVLFQLFHDQFIGISTTTYVLLCFENWILCFSRALYHKWYEFSLYILVTRLQGRGWSLELG